jgi:hypothetical protein
MTGRFIWEGFFTASLKPFRYPETFRNTFCFIWTSPNVHNRMELYEMWKAYVVVRL